VEQCVLAGLWALVFWGVWELARAAAMALCRIRFPRGCALLVPVGGTGWENALRCALRLRRWSDPGCPVELTALDMGLPEEQRAACAIFCRSRGIGFAPGARDAGGAISVANTGGKDYT